MKYLKQTFSYLKKSFWLPLVVMIVPAVVACFLSTPYWEVSFVTAFEYDPYVSIKSTFAILFGDSWQYIWPVIVISVFQIVSATLVMSAIDKHFRTGKLSLHMPVRLVNNAIFPMTVGVLIMCAVSILMRFVLFGLVTLVQVSGRAMNMIPGAALSIISVVAVVLFFFHMLIITPMLFWAPIMFIYGYRFRDAAAMSFKMLSGKKVFRGMALPMLLCAAIQMIVGFLNVHYAVELIVNFIMFLVTNAYVPVYVMVSFYDITGFERRDIKPYELLSLPDLSATEQNKPDKTASADQNAADGENTNAPSRKKPSAVAKNSKQNIDKQSARSIKRKTGKQRAEKPNDKNAEGNSDVV